MDGACTSTPPGSAKVSPSGALGSTRPDPSIPRPKRRRWQQPSTPTVRPPSMRYSGSLRSSAVRRPAQRLLERAVMHAGRGLPVIGDVPDPWQRLGRVQRQWLAGVFEGAPDNRHDAAVALGQSGALANWLRLQPSRVDETISCPSTPSIRKMFSTVPRSSRSRIVARSSSSTSRMTASL